MFSEHSLGAESLERALSLLACEGAISGAETVSEAEAEALLRALVDAEAPEPCVHGRAVVSLLTFQELERKSGRS